LHEQGLDTCREEFKISWFAPLLKVQ